MADLRPSLLVLGMHRSGTSCLTGALERCGAYVGPVRRTGRFNSRGYFELATLVRLHEEILVANGGSWNAPPPNVTVSPSHRWSLEQIAALYAHHRPYALKDPRLLLLLDHWTSLVGDTLRLVGTFRHPLAVARSLAHRNGMREAEVLALWTRYNAALVARHRADPFPLVRYDLRDPEAYCQSVAAAAERVGLVPDWPSLRAFVDGALEHHAVDDAAVPAECAELYAYLVAHQLRPARPATSSGPARIAPDRVAEAASSTVSTGLWGTGRRVARWAVRRMGEATVGVERVGHRRRAAQADRSGIRALLLFVGNPRCGTTVVRTLLDAHPNVSLGNEVNILERLRDGEDWLTVTGRILASAAHFRRRPEWAGYRYALADVGAAGPLAILGDKKAGGTATLLTEDVLLLDRLERWSPVPVHVLHCVRDPRDVIATKTRRNGRSIDWNVARYFEVERTAAYVADRLPPDRYHRIHLEQLVADPGRELRALTGFLGLEASDAYLAAGTALLFDRPAQSRDGVAWTPTALTALARETARCPHLSSYITPEGQLRADAVTAPTRPDARAAR